VVAGGDGGSSGIQACAFVKTLDSTLRNNCILLHVNYDSIK
jgi:hypothetical protein